MISLRVISPPSDPVYRVAKRIHDPFEPKPWSLADENGVFGDRFDDPRDWELPESERFRTIYCATTPAGALGETVARVRPQLGEIPGLTDIEENSDEPESTDAHLSGLRDPEDPQRGVLLANWRLERQLYNTQLKPSLCFVDIFSPGTVHCLRRELGHIAVRLGLQDIDFSTVTGSMREFTRECARYIYEQTDDHGRPLYAGIRYVSRLNHEWECWAIFHDRMEHIPGFPETIFPNDPAPLQVAKLFHMSIETIAGAGHYIRP